MQAKINGAYVTTTPSVKVGGVYKPITNTFVKINGVYKDAGYLQKCFAYNFDGIDDRGVLQNRAINIDGDNTFEFWSPSALTPGQNIIGQSLNATSALMEFRLFVGGSGTLEVTVGGVITAILTVVQGFQPSSRYGLSLTGTNFSIRSGGLTGAVIRSGTLSKGAAREPTAPTVVGARGNGVGSFVQFFQGPQYDIRINNTLWSMAERNQAIQTSIPAGNPMTLVNTTTDRWEEVACNLRVAP